VLVYVSDPGAAVGEMARVTRPGGRVVVSDVDIGTLFIDSEAREMTRHVIASFTDALASGWSGRSLRRLLQGAGLHNVACVPRVIHIPLRFLHLLLDGHLADGAVAARFGAEDLAAWWRDLAERDERGQFYAGVTVFSVVGERAETGLRA
jgi:hypothetical protein